MDAQSLFERLLKAEDEAEVDTILEEAGYWEDDPNIWHPFGEYKNNFNLVGNQQADPTAAFVEKIINAIDAMLLAECRGRKINPEGSEAPQSMAKAVELFFGVKDGRLENISTSELTRLADNIHLVAVGAKKTPSYLIIDRGEGQTPKAFPDTFLSLTHENKTSIPFVQGKFNCGGTGILQFCGKRNYQLIVSRRNPAAIIDSSDPTKELWGFTIVRRMLPRPGKKTSTYVYLAPNSTVPSFSADEIKVLPGDSGKDKPAKAYSVGLQHGTCIKLYNYRWKPKSIATTEARYELERYLHFPCLPFRLTETREFKANYYSATLTGVWASIRSTTEEKSKVEKGFPSDGILNLPDIGRLPYQIILFKQEFNPRRFPHGVFFTVNGQVHGQLPANFISSSVRFDFLSDYLLVSIDCTHMNDQVREDFFMASRDRLRRNEVYDAIFSALKEELRSHAGLREHNAFRKQQELEKTLSDEKHTADFFQDLLKTDPTLATLLGVGDKLVTTTGPTNIITNFVGKKFPTYFRLSKEPKDGLVKSCPLNRTVRIEFDTDAENNYFERADVPGEITFNPPNLCISSHLWNGKFNTRFQMPWDANVGDKVEVKVTITDIERETLERPFISTFTLKGAPESEEPSHEGGRKRDGSKRDTNGKHTAPVLTPPKIREVRRDQWDSPSFKFNEFSAVKIAHDDEDGDGYIFFINIENTFLLTELTRVNEEEKPLLKFWFKYGLSLSAMGILLEEKRRQKEGAGDNSEAEGEDADSENLEQVTRYCNGLARVIVPIIRRLYRGPQVTTSTIA